MNIVDQHRIEDFVISVETAGHEKELRLEPDRRVLGSGTARNCGQRPPHVLPDVVLLSDNVLYCLES